MTVYKYLLKSFSRNKILFVIWLGIFTLITFAIAGLPEDSEKKYETSALEIGISQEAKDERLVKFLEGNKDEIQRVQVENNEKKAKEAVFLDGLDFVLIKDKKTNTLLGFSSPAGKKSYMARMRLNSFLNFVKIVDYKDINEKSHKETKVDENVNKRDRKSKKNKSEEIQRQGNEKAIDRALKISRIKIEAKQLNEDSKRSTLQIWYHYIFRYLSYPLMATIMSIIGIGIISYKNEKTEERIMISSMSLTKRKVQTFLAELVCTILILFLSLLVVFAMGRYGEVNYGNYIINTLAFSLSSLAFIFLITHINANKYFVSPFSALMPMVLAFISGVFVPTEFLPNFAITLSRFFPMYYYIRANELSIDGASMDYWVYILIQVLFAVFFFSLALFIEKLGSKKATGA